MKLILLTLMIAAIVPVLVGAPVAATNHKCPPAVGETDAGRDSFDKVPKWELETINGHYSQSGSQVYTNDSGIWQFGPSGLHFTAHELNRWRALSMVESGDCDTCTGPNGERSRFQITPRNWRLATTLPLSASTNPFTAANVAQDIQYPRVLRFAARHHRMPTNAEFYLIWHCPARVARPTAAERDYSERCVNVLGRLENPGHLPPQP